MSMTTPTTASTAAVSRTSLWTGRILSSLVITVFLVTGLFSLLKPELAAQGFAHYGYPDGALLPITLVEIACAIVYAIPRTSVLGAILLTAYLGGATATHVRAGEPFFLPVVVGIVVWLGLFLRDGQLRAHVPWRGLNATS
jgi:hypothetical protein